MTWNDFRLLEYSHCRRIKAYPESKDCHDLSYSKTAARAICTGLVAFYFSISAECEVQPLSTARRSIFHTPRSNSRVALDHITRTSSTAYSYQQPNRNMQAQILKTKSAQVWIKGVIVSFVSRVVRSEYLTLTGRLDLATKFAVGTNIAACRLRVYYIPEVGVFDCGVTTSLTARSQKFTSGRQFCREFASRLLYAFNAENSNVVFTGYLTSSASESLSSQPSQSGSSFASEAGKRNVSGFKIMTVARGYTEEADKILDFLVLFLFFSTHTCSHNNDLHHRRMEYSMHYKNNTSGVSCLQSTWYELVYAPNTCWGRIRFAIG